jgi:hypothetical protein
MFNALYGVAHAALILGIVGACSGAIWFGWVLWYNHTVRTEPGPGRRRRRLRWRLPIALLLAAALLIGFGSYLGQTRVSVTTVGALFNQGRTEDQAGLRTEAEIYKTTVATTVYFKLLPGGTPSSNLINKVTKYLTEETTDVDVEVGVYGLVNLAAAQASPAVINQSARSITVNLPKPTEETYIYSVGGVRITQGPLRALATAVEAAVASIVGRPIVSTDISGQLAAAQKSLARSANQAEVYGCGSIEMARQLAGLFASLPQYRGWSVGVDLGGLQPESASVCSKLQKQLAWSG